VPGLREIEPAISRRRFKGPPSPGRPNSLDAVNVERPPGFDFARSGRQSARHR
jgi:hypothetical protein